MSAAEVLKSKVEFIVNKFGYKTSYADNMLDAIDRVINNDPDYRISIGDVVIFTDKDMDVVLRFNNQVVMPYSLSWSLYELLGMYILNQNQNYFDEN